MTPEKPSDPEPRRVTVRGTGASYTDEGDGPPIVAIHGVPGSGRDFRWLASALQAAPGAGVRFVRIDMPGFGGTPVAAGRGATLVERADYILDVLHQLRIGRAVILGHSMGGPVAVAVAARAPERVDGLALIASPGLRAHRGLRRLAVHAIAPLLQIAPTRALLRVPLGLAFRASGFPSSVSWDELVRTVELAAATSIHEHAARIRALRAPCLVAWAEDDHLVEPAVSVELARACPPGPRVTWLEGGHNIQKTHAVELARALAAWTHEVSTPRDAAATVVV